MVQKGNSLRRRFHISVFLLLSLPTFVQAQQETLKLRPDVFRFADGVLHTYSAPARWDKKDWLVLGGLVVGTSALSFLDQPVRNFWLKQDNRFLDGVQQVGDHYGRPYSAFGFTAGFYLTGMIFRNEWCKETGLLLGTSLMTSGLLTRFIKDAAGRARPATAANNLEFQPFEQSSAFHAFPSGHATFAFAISVVMARRVESIPLKILFYSLAGTTAVSRMYSDSHWISDVGFGGMLAWFCADVAISRMQVNRFRTVRAKDKLVWNVFPYPGGLTVRASIR
jgi:membrane-associated phospholipid phosphatase